MYYHCKPSLYWESANASSLQLFFMESHSASWGCSKYITSPGSLTHRKNTKNLFTPANITLFYTAECRGVRRLFGYDITGSSYRSTVKLTCRWSSLEGWLLAAVWPMQSLVEQGYLLSSLYLLESALQLDNWLFWVLMIQLTRQKAKDFLTL